MAAQRTAAEIAKSWNTDPRWKGIQRPYTPEDVARLRGTLHIEYTLARMGAERLWEMLNSESYVNALGAMTGNQAIADGRSRPEGDLRERLAGCGGRQQCRADVSRSEPLPCRLGSQPGAPPEQCADCAPIRSITPKARTV